MKSGAAYRNISQGTRNILMYVLMPLLVLCLAFILARSLKYGVLTGVGLIGLGLLFVCIANPKLAFYITITYVFFVYFIQRLVRVDFHVGLGTEAMTITLLLGVLIQKVLHHEKIWHHLRNPITYLYLIQVIYLGLEALNPNIDSLIGWNGFYRRFVETFIFFLVSLYLMNSKKEIFQFIKFWLVLTFLTALYGCYQQWIGLPSSDFAWATANPLRYGLLFQYGFLRKFSFLSDPVSFGILMASTSVLAFSLAIGQKKTNRILLLSFMGLIMTLAMSYSGTRTATVLEPIGIAFFAMITIQNKKTVIFLGLSILIFGGLIFSPIHSSSVINRLRSAFHPETDPSMKIRDINRKRIQPYMHAHPMGGGLGTTGFPGLVNYPNHPLAGFPPDGQFVQDALEIGWIGFLLELLFYFIVMKFGVHNFYHCRDPQIKNLYASLTAVMMCWVVSEFSQGATGAFNITYLYLPTLAIMVRLRHFDREPDHPPEVEKRFVI